MKPQNIEGKQYEVTNTPSVLLVEDDPILCSQFEKKAKRLNLNLTVCKTVGDVTKMPAGSTFDVAIMDYFFGELTAFQLSHFLKEEVPIILISNTEARKISGDSWPPIIRTFVHKRLGTDAILREALRTAGFGDYCTRQSEGS